jgi:hypothetical protein
MPERVDFAGASGGRSCRVKREHFLLSGSLNKKKSIEPKAVEYMIFLKIPVQDFI